ncbi:hypothetical protein E2320_013457, partial [Naja naja]
IEQVSQLLVLVEAALDYHKQSAEILEDLQSKLQNRLAQAGILLIFVVSTYRAVSQLLVLVEAALDYHKQSAEILEDLQSKLQNRSSLHMDQPCCQALYDFEPENEGELGFKEGDIITLTNQIDENWAQKSNFLLKLSSIAYREYSAEIKSC